MVDAGIDMVRRYTRIKCPHCLTEVGKFTAIASASIRCLKCHKLFEVIKTRRRYKVYA